MKNTEKNYPEINQYVCIALFKSPVSVKHNLGIIISSKTAESHLSQPVPTPTPPQRYREKGVVRVIVGTLHDGLIEGIVLRCVRGRKRNDEVRLRRRKKEKLMTTKNPGSKRK